MELKWTRETDEPHAGTENHGSNGEEGHEQVPQGQGRGLWLGHRKERLRSWAGVASELEGTE